MALVLLSVTVGHLALKILLKWDLNPLIEELRVYRAESFSEE